MSKRSFKRVISCFLAAIIAGGALCPSLANAAIGDVTQIYGDISVVKKVVTGYYSSTGSGNNQPPNATTRAATNGNVTGLYVYKDGHDTIQELVPLANVAHSDYINAVSAATGITKDDWLNLGNLDQNSDHNYTKDVLLKIHESLGSGCDDVDTLMERLANLNNIQGAMQADMSNLSQRFAAILYMHLNPEGFMDTSSSYRWDSYTGLDSGDYKTILDSTIGIEHNDTLQTMLDTITNSATPTGNSVITGSKVYSASQFGVLSGFVTNDSSVYDRRHNAINENFYSSNNQVFIINEFAAYCCIKEYANFQITRIPDITSTQGWETDESVKSVMTYVRVFNDAFGDFIPIIRAIYETPNGQYSLKDMVEKCGAADTTLDDAKMGNSDEYVPHTDTTSPITTFYTVNGDIGIVSYDRDAILSDIEVSKPLGNLLSTDEKEEYQNRKENSDLDRDQYYVANMYLSNQAIIALHLREELKRLNDQYGTDFGGVLDIPKNKRETELDKLKQWVEGHTTDTVIKLITTQANDTLSESINTAINEKDYLQLASLLIKDGPMKVLEEIENKENFNNNALAYLAGTYTLKSLAEENPDAMTGGIDENGVAKSMYAVTINQFIVEGMGYSTGYIPMRTNMYTPDTLNMFKDNDEQTDFYRMYLKYGFMRKALLIDTSSSSAADYYTAGGKLTGNTRVCTLRDLLYSENRDVTLYLDSQFYNSGKAIDEGNKILSEAHDNNVELAAALEEYATLWDNMGTMTAQIATALANAVENFKSVMFWAANKITGAEESDDASDIPTWEEVSKKLNKEMMNKFGFNMKRFETSEDVINFKDKLDIANSSYEGVQLDDSVLKTNDATSYSDLRRAMIADIDDSKYVNLIDDDYTFNVSDSLTSNSLSTIDGGDIVKVTKNSSTDDNTDTLVLPSSLISQYLSPTVSFSSKDTVTDENDVQSTVTTTYNTIPEYSPMVSLAYISCLYRDDKSYALANAVEYNNPVFMASDDLCGIKEANQWYRNTLLNYALLKNLIGNAQIDAAFTADLDCPVYMDIFGNILTESGTVVIPAAANATLHPGSFKDNNYAVALYSCYGKEYYVPIDCEGADTVLNPYFVPNHNNDLYVVNAITMNANGKVLRFDKVDTYNDETRSALRVAYKACISHADSTRLNWMAIVKIINEVMRGAPIESINKEDESLYISQNKSSLIAAAKLEALLESLKGSNSNTLLSIPDFSRMDGMEYWIAILIKLMMVATAAVIIVAIYRDGVSGQLGIRTFTKSVAAIGLTVSCIVVVPTIFQLTYYSSNKLLLEDEALRILMVNEEKRQGGAEIGITSTNTVESNGEFAIQLDWINVPWYEELENILYDKSLDNLQQVKLKAYRETATYNNTDVTVYNDGVYVTTDDLFDSVAIDYTFNSTGSTRGLYLNTTDSSQTASFYSPYYVFLRTIVANINEYNRWMNTSEYKYKDEQEAIDSGEEDNREVLGSYNYTTKYMSQNRPKTVGLCEAYFTSKGFMEEDEDILRLKQIYMGVDPEIDEGLQSTEFIQRWNDLKARANRGSNGELSEDSKAAIEEMKKYNPVKILLQQREDTLNRALIFSDEDRKLFEQSYWFDSDLVYADMEYYLGLLDVQDYNDDLDVYYSASDQQKAYLDKRVANFDSKVEAMDNFCRDFIAENKDMIGRVSDETFIKTMALAMAIKYNQLFGVTSANSLEIYNMSSEDLLRLCLVPSNEAVTSVMMSYPRFIHTFGGEAGVYLGAVLSVILWVGSYIKPLCTIIVFVSVFLSIFVFRVVLRKPSANILGYLVTCGLLCLTNFLHALILKIGVWLPNTGLSALGCMIFIIVGQVAYLLVLSYVAGVSLKDWSNLGANEYEKEARNIRSKFSKNDTSNMLSGNIKHHDNNWDYYNDLVDQHRSRNI